MLAELLLTLSGHASSIFTPGGLPPDATSSAPLKTRQLPALSLHPAERASLDALAALASKYVRVRDFCKTELERARSLALRGVTHDKKRGVVTAHMAPLCATIMAVLQQYHRHILSLETAVLQRDPRLVGSASFVSLAGLRAAVEEWEAPLSALDAFVTQLVHGPGPVASKEEEPTSASAAALGAHAAWTGGQLLDLLFARSRRAVGASQECFQALLAAVERSWGERLVGWMCYGEVDSPIDSLVESVEPPKDADRLSNQLDHHDVARSQHIVWDGSGLGNDIDGRTYRFRDGALPSSLSPETIESILYVGRAITTISRSWLASVLSTTASSVRGGESRRFERLPQELVAAHSELLRRTGPCGTAFAESSSARRDRTVVSTLAFERAVHTVREEVSEWIWRNVLTPETVTLALRTLGGVFLQRSGSFHLSLLTAIETARAAKLQAARSAATAILQPGDLERALHRAAVGTEEEDNPGLDKMRFSILSPASRRHHSVSAGHEAKQRDESAPSDVVRFDDLLLPGLRVQLHYSASYPLDLFFSAADLATYSRIFGYLAALRRTQARVLACWRELSKAQRTRRRFTIADEGGVDKSEGKVRTAVMRNAWSAVRDMLWFLDTLLAHLQTDVIDVQYTRLLAQIQGGQQQQHSGGGGGGYAQSVYGGGAQSVAGPIPSSASYAHGMRRASSFKATMSAPSQDTLRGPSRARTNTGRSSRGGLPTGGGTFIGPGGPASIAPTTFTTTAGGALGAGGHAAILDFATLRSTHAAFLAHVADGMLLSSPAACARVRAVVETCERFTARVELWGGDVLPDLLEGGSAEEDMAISARRREVKLEQRASFVSEAAETLRTQLDEFFVLLSSDSSSSGTSGIAPTVGDASLSAHSISLTLQTAAAAAGGVLAAHAAAHSGARLDADVAARRHVEQLLLRLDYNGHFSAARESRLAEKEEEGTREGRTREGGTRERGNVLDGLKELEVR